MSSSAPKKKPTLKKNHGKKKRPLIRMAILFILLLVVLFGVIPVGIFNLVVQQQAEAVIALENEGKLSKERGYVWSEIQNNRRMELISLGDDPVEMTNDTSLALGFGPSTYPSLEAIDILNNMSSLSNRIVILDRNGIELGDIATTQNLLPLDQFPPLLISTLLLTEDQNFATRSRAYEPLAFYRAIIVALYRSIRTMELVSPRGTSTIHQQVARFLLASFDDQGHIFVEHSMTRKIREIILAEALKRYYSNDDILTIYMNHCVTAGQGMVGFHDIARGLFRKKPSDLSDAQILYLSRLVKWNSNKPEKIIRQVRTSLPRIQEANNWSDEKVKNIDDSLSLLTFHTQAVVNTEYSHLFDLANEQWLRACRMQGYTGEQLKDMDISDPNSLLRQKGNLAIQLTIDIRLQTLLEREVNNRGFGGDTTIMSDERIGSSGESKLWNKPIPPDTLRAITVLQKDSSFSEPDKEFVTKLSAGDTLITNVRYRKEGFGMVRCSRYFYKRSELKVGGQYFSYVMIDAKSGELLAYYSRDALGSRLSSLLRNRVPNGSALAKPIIYALNYDAHNWEPHSMASDAEEVANLPWARTFLVDNNGDTTGMRYLNAGAEGSYPVRNHARKFDGYDYYFNHLAESNNVITIESLFRLNAKLNSGNDPVKEEYLQALLTRIGAATSVDADVHGDITGPRIYSELARLVYSDIDGDAKEKNIISNSNYSYGLGTLELSIYEIAHLFNMLYNNSVIKKPAMHPSLVIKSATLSGIPFKIKDEIETVHPFEDINRIEPVKLALFKRLSSNGTDAVAAYDLCTAEGVPTLYPLVNYAKSGTTDNVLRPYNSDPAKKESTNYGIWNGTFRVVLPSSEVKRLLPKGVKAPKDELFDITVACVAEANRKNTGATDGKSIHKFLTAALMRTYGEAGCQPGYYTQLEQQISVGTPSELLYKEVDADATSFFKKLFSSNPIRGAEMQFKGKKNNLSLDRATLKTLEAYAPYMGNNEIEYQELIASLESVKDKSSALQLVGQLSTLQTDHPVVQKELRDGVKALRASLESM